MNFCMGYRYTFDRYVVERCESHAEDVYKEVWRGCATESSLLNLRPVGEFLCITRGCYFDLLLPSTLTFRSLIYCRA